MERDIFQKMNMVKLLWNWGFVPEIDVRLFNPQGVSKSKIEFTDIDVLGIKVNGELAEEKVAADCKTAKQTSPINRAFWFSGLMKHMNIDRGLLILSKQAELDHKLAAKNLNIVIMNDEEFERYSSSIIRNRSINSMSMINPEVWQDFFSKTNTVSQLKGVWNYRKFRYWQDNHQRQIRYTLMEMRQASKEVTQKNKLITAMFLDVMTLFSLSMTSMVIELFQSHFIFNNKTDLDVSLKAYIYDGRDNYDHLNSLTKRVLSLKETILYKDTDTTKIRLSEKELELPEWESFIQLVRTALDSPLDFIKVPHVLRFILFERILTTSDVKIKDVIRDYSDNAVKLALDVLKYFTLSTEIPSYIWHPIREELDKVILESTSNESGTEIKTEITLEKEVNDSDSTVS